MTQADLPGESASGRRGKCPLDTKFLSRGHHGDFFVPANHGKVIRKVRMFQIIQNQVGLNVTMYILFCIVNHRRKMSIDGYDFYGKVVVSVEFNTFYFL